MSEPGDAAVAAIKKLGSQKREYVVLEERGEANVWEALGTYSASSVSAAKRLAIIAASKVSGDKTFGRLIAVPAGHWHPTTPTVTAETTLRIEGI